MTTPEPDAADTERDDADDPETERPRFGRRELAIHGGLFLAACVTTSWAGGLWFGATLMTILVCHEMGHYVAARRHGVDVSLPFFIPLPPQISLGTMGAVIRMKAPITDRNQLLDVGAAGPLAGLAVALPLLVVGIARSEVRAVPDSAVLEGNSVVYLLLKYLVHGRWLPTETSVGMVDIQLHPMAMAAWVGLLITMINLIPIGQLDGGHIARAALGDAHERWSGRLHRVLVVIATGIGAVLYTQARGVGADPMAALGYAGWGIVPWLTWALMLTVMRRMAGGTYHPPVSGPPLSPGRRVVAWLMLVVFALIVTPVPMRPALPPRPDTLFLK